MKQMTFADAGFAGKRKQTRKALFLFGPLYPTGEGGRPAYPLIARLWEHLVQDWFGYRHPASVCRLACGAYPR